MLGGGLAVVGYEWLWTVVAGSWCWVMGIQAQAHKYINLRNKYRDKGAGRGERQDWEQRGAGSRF